MLFCYCDLWPTKQANSSRHSSNDGFKGHVWHWCCLSHAAVMVSGVHVPQPTQKLKGTSFSFWHFSYLDWPVWFRLEWWMAVRGRPYRVTCLLDIGNNTHLAFQNASIWCKAKGRQGWSNGKVSRYEPKVCVVFQIVDVLSLTCLILWCRSFNTLASE